MQAALELFSHLEQEDIDWIFQASNEMQIIANTRVVLEGEKPDALYFVLEGLLGVRTSAMGNRQIATLGPGEILGEIAFLDGLPASATVQAVENSLLLVLPCVRLEEKLAVSPVFAVRFLRSLAKAIARRLRHTTGIIGHRAQHDYDDAAISTADSAALLAELDQFKSAMQQADLEALKAGGVVPVELAASIRAGFRSFCVRANERLGADSEWSPGKKEEIGRRIQREILPYLLLTGTAERIYAKPRGYAGDFLTIEKIYQNEAAGSGRLGPLLDRCFLDEPAAVAVRNRRHLLVEEIRQTLAEKTDGTVRVASLACGPARELFDVYETDEAAARLESTLIDIDLQALAYVEDRLIGKPFRRRFNLQIANLVYLATGRKSLDMPEQDLVYSIGLIDYFNDKYVVNLLNYIHKILIPGGRVILGNFHPANTSRSLMDHVLDWKLIHRTESDMDRLFQASNFGLSCSRVRFEEQNINLFAVCEKRAKG